MSAALYNGYLVSIRLGYRAPSGCLLLLALLGIPAAAFALICF